MPGSKKRVSMKGMGADAFFAPPTETDEEEQVSTSTPVQKQASREGEKQLNITPVHQETTTEVIEQNTGKELQRYTSEPAERQTSKFIKASYYISPDDDWKLEQIRIKRRRRGVKIDKSALIREAIALLQE